MTASPTDLLTGALAELAKVQPKPGSSTPLANGKAKVREARTVLETPPPPPPIEEPPLAGILWGARMDGSAYGSAIGDAPWTAATWDRFEADAGKKVTICAWGNPFGSLDLNALGTVKARGATSLVTYDLPVAEILSGAKNAAIDAFAAKAKSFGSPFVLRPGWEMNGTWYAAWARNSNYAAAWRYFHDRVVAAGATKVQWCWCVNGLYGTGSDPAPYYPGDAYVDLLGLDSYNWGVGSAKPERWRTPAEVHGPTLDRLKVIAPGKKVWICETASTEHGGNKAEWITQLLTAFLPSRPEVAALTWFNDVADAAGMDWIIETSPAAQAAFKAGVASAYYLGP